MKKIFVFLFLFYCTKCNAQSLPVNILKCQTSFESLPCGQKKYSELTISDFNQDINQYVGLLNIFEPCVSGFPSNNAYWTEFLKLDNNFNIVSSKIIGDYKNLSAVQRLIKISNDRYLGIGICRKDTLDFTSNWPINQGTIWLGIIDINGNILHHNTIGYQGSININDVVTSSTGALYLGGSAYTNLGDFSGSITCGLNNQPFIVKCDTLLNKVWLHNFNTCNDATLLELEIDSKENLIASFGVYWEPSASNNGIYSISYPGNKKQTMLVKMDTNLVLQYSRLFGDSTDFSTGFPSIENTKDDDLLLVLPRSIYNKCDYNLGIYKYLYGAIIRLDSLGNTKAIYNYGCDSILGNNIGYAPNFNAISISKPNKNRFRVLKTHINKADYGFVGDKISGDLNSSEADLFYMLVDSNFKIINYRRVGGSHQEQMNFTYELNLFDEGNGVERFISLESSSSDSSEAIPYGCAPAGHESRLITEIMAWPNSIPTIDNQKLSFKIYPNPSNGLLNIQSTALKYIKSTYKICNSVGAVLQKGNLRNNEIDVQSLAKGIYILQLEEGGFRGIERFVME